MVRGMALLRAMPSLRQPLDFLVQARATYGDVYAVDLGFTKLILFNHPRHAQHILRDRVAIYRKGGALWDSIRTLLGNGLIVSEGDFWRRQRRMMQPHFHRERLNALTNRMVGSIHEGIATLDAAAISGDPINIVPEMANIAMKVIVGTMFGTGVDRADADRVGRDLTYVIDFMLRGMFFRSLPPWMPVPGRRRYQEAVRAIDDVVYRLIAQRQHESGASGDLIMMLLDMVDAETEQRMTNTELRDEALTIFLAGYETSSATVSWACHFLTRHPEHWAALEREVDTVLGGRTPAFADLPRLEYARRILEESLRLVGPVFWLPRQATEDDEIDGWLIPKGATVGVMVYAIHRHPEIWERPEEFNPERFLESRVASRPPHSWLPFGAGQRLCIGKDFAMMEGQLILASLAQRYSMNAVPGRSATAHMGTTLSAKGGVWVRLERRRPR